MNGTEHTELDEDIAALEDKPVEKSSDVIVRPPETGIEPDTPVYQLRLSYSHETFLAIYRGEYLQPGSSVVVSTRFGRDLATVTGTVSCPSSEITMIERPASKEDLERAANNKSQEKTALRICREKIEKHQLDMKLISVHYLLDYPSRQDAGARQPGILFFFTAETRVDFRKLVDDLVKTFHTRIELRQIGVRDESRVLGGLGVCGRGFCCHMISDKLKPVTIKMAKDQNLSLNSMKISGPCGRLLCCLSYEHGFYNEQRRLVPQEGTRLSYDGTNWKVSEINIATGRITMTAEDDRILILPFCRLEKKDNHWVVV